MKNSILFTSKSIGNLNLKNRFIRSATHNNTSDPQGYPTAQTKLVFDDLANGEIALIITGATAINKCNGYYIMDDDKYIKPWQKITDSVHKKGSLIAMQIFHPGRQQKVQNNNTSIAPSAIPPKLGQPIPKSMTLTEIEDTIEAFAQSGLRAKKAGFDAIQLHVAHGYLLSSFISPASNIRKDKYGGSIENRSRIVVDIIKRTRELLGNDYPILAKLNFIDGLQGGLKENEGLAIAKIMTKTGIDSIEISGGTLANIDIPLRKIKSEDEESYFKNYAKILKNELDIPVMLVGGNRSFNRLEKIIESKNADFISLCRPLISEPNLVKRWYKGDISKPKCISCNACLRPLSAGKPIYCVVNKKTNR